MDARAYDISWPSTTRVDVVVVTSSVLEGAKIDEA